MSEGQKHKCPGRTDEEIYTEAEAELSIRQKRKCQERKESEMSKEAEADYYRPQERNGNVLRGQKHKCPHHNYHLPRVSSSLGRQISLPSHTTRTVPILTTG